MCGRAAQSYRVVQAAQDYLTGEAAGREVRGSGNHQQQRQRQQHARESRPPTRPAAHEAATAAGATLRNDPQQQQEENLSSTDSVAEAGPTTTQTPKSNESNENIVDSSQGGEEEIDGAGGASVDPESRAATAQTTGAETSTLPAEEGKGNDDEDSNYNNYNMSPGMDAVVFWRDPQTGELKADRKVWGLVTRGGTVNHPIPLQDMRRHFNNMMFNAKSETLTEKVTFARLLQAAGQTCVIAVDGFYEWKTQLASTKKQPYFVYRRRQQQQSDATQDKAQSAPTFLLFAGLWTCVPTGNPTKDHGAEMLSTFTILTTAVCDTLQWLHTRMPVPLWSAEMAWKWLSLSSSASTHRELVLQDILTEAYASEHQALFAWHAVTTDMTSLKFRSAKAMAPLPQYKTVKSFFTTASASAAASPASVQTKPKNVAAAAAVKNVKSNNKNATSSSIHMDEHKEHGSKQALSRTSNRPLAADEEGDPSSSCAATVDWASSPVASPPTGSNNTVLSSKSTHRQQKGGTNSKSVSSSATRSNNKSNTNKSKAATVIIPAKRKGTIDSFFSAVQKKPKT